MRLIVGLGNPDPEYQWTPHNLGFMAVDELANRNSIRVERPEGKALVGRERSPEKTLLLAKPQTYMNLSGISVRELLAKYELESADLLVMWDEVQLPLGTIRIRPQRQRRQPQRREVGDQRAWARRSSRASDWAAGRIIRSAAAKNSCCGR